MATIDPAVLDRMADAYHFGYERILDSAEFAAEQAWFGLDSLSEEDEWEAMYWLIVSGAVDAISALVSSFIIAQMNYLGVVPMITAPDMSILARNQFDDWSLSPMIRARWLVSEGMDPDAAIREAAIKVSHLVNAVIRVTEQQAKVEVFTKIDQGPAFLYANTRPGFLVPTPQTPSEAVAMAARLDAEGFRLAVKPHGALKWKREPTRAGACGWCVVMSSRLLSERSRQKDNGWHTNCKCKWRMVTPDESRSWVDPYADGSWRQIIDRRSTPAEEGELVNA